MNKIKEKNNTIDELDVIKSFSAYESIEPKQKEMVERDKEDFEKWVSEFDNDILLNEALLVLSDIHATNTK